MCGITGIWNLQGDCLSRGELDRFTDALAHRGPDGRGIYIDPDVPLGMGHRRLSIFDTSDCARQPLSSSDGRYWISYNGEIFNFLEIREELVRMGYTFRTDSDTEVILAAYDKWGEKCLFRFNGMWAFAIWDTREKKLFIARDRFGVKPLHYYYDGRYFAFASEMKAFLSLSWFDPAFDQEMIAMALTSYWRVEGMERCLLRNLKKLPGGHYLTLASGKEPVLTRWWKTIEHLEPVPQTYEEQVERFKELFLDACRIRMRSDVSLGTSLSGGLDSSSALCGMRYVRSNSPQAENRISPDWQRAFVATYPHTPDDERIFADEVIRYTETIPVYCEVTPEKVIEHFEEITFYYEELSDIHVGPWLVYEAERNNRVVVSIDGHGGDELLGGYPQYISAILEESLFPLPNFTRVKELKTTLKNLYSPGGTHPIPTLKGIWFSRVFGFMRALKKKGISLIPDRLHCKQSLSGYRDSTGWLKILPPEFTSSAYREDCIATDGFDLLFRQLYMDYHHFLLPTNLRDFDRLSMAHGVEVRSPFLDWHLVCYTFSLPSEDKIGNGYTKRILRDAMKGILPESIRTRTIKGGFANPGGDWIFDKAGSLILKTIREQDFQNSPIWDGKRILQDVEKAFKTHDSMTIRKALQFVQAYFLMKTFQERSAFSPNEGNYILSPDSD